MGHPIDEIARERIWVAMAECLVDNEIDFDRHAKNLCQYPLSDLKTIFFREVAPVCGPNMLTPVPPVWLSFDDDWVVREVKMLRAKCNRSAVFRLRHELAVLYFRARLANVWNEIELSIVRCRMQMPKN